MSSQLPINLELAVPVELGGRRLDRVAAELFDEYSRSSLAEWIQCGDLTLDGRVVKPRTRVIGGEVLRLSTVVRPREDWQTGQDVPFEVVYEDASMLVVAKPVGIVVHPGAGNPDGTLVNGLLRYREALSLLPRAGIIHRLDKDTSGLLLVAATLQSQQALTRALAAREIERRYLAITEGLMISGRDIESPIGRDPRHRTRQKVRADGRPALTRVRLRQRYRAHCLIEAELATGRTHQIRVHLASVGHPLVGDRRYGARGKLPRGADPALVECLQGFDRQALHAYKLVLLHPATGEKMAFESAMAPDMAELVGHLERDLEAGV